MDALKILFIGGLLKELAPRWCDKPLVTKRNIHVESLAWLSRPLHVLHHFVLTVIFKSELTQWHVHGWELSSARTLKHLLQKTSVSATPDLWRFGHLGVGRKKKVWLKFQVRDSKYYICLWARVFVCCFRYTTIVTRPGLAFSSHFHHVGWANTRLKVLLKLEG